MRLSLSLIATLMFAGMTWADQPARPDLNGTWKLEPAQSEIHSRVPSAMTWQIEQTDDGIHMVELEENKNAGDWHCGTDGKDCKVKDEGHNVTMSFYYNGPVLVELETEGENITKRRISVSKDGNQMSVEVIHLMPAGRPTEKLVLSKQAGATATASAATAQSH